MGGGAQEIKKTKVFKYCADLGSGRRGPGIRTKPNLGSNEQVWEVGGGAQEIEKDQSLKVFGRSGKWAAAPRN